MKIFIVDSFTELPFRGNPAAVCLADQDIPDELRQCIASEMNLSETAFITRDSGIFGLRWFSPLREVELCGHATLAAAHILWETEIVEPGHAIDFYTKSGVLKATRKSNGLIEMCFPLLEVNDADADENLLCGLGTDPVYIGKSKYDYLAELVSEEALRSVVPDMKQLECLETRGIIITSRSDSPDYDFVSRFFAPSYGIYEDPVTGSAHCALAPYWSGKLGKTTLTAYQASERGGTVFTTLPNDTEVALGGYAVTVFSGNLAI